MRIKRNAIKRVGTVHILSGVAGSGKTTRLINIAKRSIEATSAMPEVKKQLRGYDVAFFTLLNDPGDKGRLASTLVKAAGVEAKPDVALGICKNIGFDIYDHNSLISNISNALVDDEGRYKYNYILCDKVDVLLLVEICKLATLHPNLVWWVSLEV